VKTPVAAQIADRTESHMVSMRKRGGGPPFERRCGVVMYPLKALKQWVRQRNAKIRARREEIQRRQVRHAAERKRAEERRRREKAEREQLRASRRECQYCHREKDPEEFRSLYQCKKCKRARDDETGCGHYPPRSYRAKAHQYKTVEATTVAEVKDWERRRLEQVKRDHDRIAAITNAARVGYGGGA